MSHYCNMISFIQSRNRIADTRQHVMKVTKEIAQCQASLSHVQAQMSALQGDMIAEKAMTRKMLTTVTQGSEKEIPTA